MFIYISQYNKNLLISGAKELMPAELQEVFHLIYIFFWSFQVSVAVSSFIIMCVEFHYVMWSCIIMWCRVSSLCDVEFHHYVCRVSSLCDLASLHLQPRQAPKKPVINRVNFELNIGKKPSNFADMQKYYRSSNLKLSPNTLTWMLNHIRITASTKQTLKGKQLRI